MVYVEENEIEKYISIFVVNGSTVGFSARTNLYIDSGTYNCGSGNPVYTWGNFTSQIVDRKFNNEGNTYMRQSVTNVTGGTAWKNWTVNIVKPNILGDINGDGSITVADTLLYLRYSVGQNISPYHIDTSDDVTCDGKATVADALMVLRKSVGQDVNLSCQA
jgi:hypothetical protein